MRGKHIFIINRNTVSEKDAIKYGKEVTAVCASERIIPHIFETTNPKETELILNVCTRDDERYYVYVAGGDGTVNNVLNCMDLDRGILQIHPLGTGNDTAKSFCFGSNLKERIPYSKEQLMDLGTVNGIYFGNIASVGFDAEVADNVKKYKSLSLPGWLKYYMSLFYTLTKYEPIEISYDKNPEEKLLKTLVTVCNGSYYGGGTKISPNSVINDGKFNVITAPDLTKLRIAKLLLHVLRGTHLKQKDIEEIITDGIQLSSDIPLTCNYDGEIMYGKSFEFKCHKKVLRIR